MPSTQSRLLPFSGKTWLTYRYIETTLFSMTDTAVLYSTWYGVTSLFTVQKRKERESVK